MCTKQDNSLHSSAHRNVWMSSLLIPLAKQNNKTSEKFFSRSLVAGSGYEGPSRVYASKDDMAELSLLLLYLEVSRQAAPEVG